MRKVKIDLPLHSLDLLANQRVVAFMRDHRERRLESVREIGRFRERAPHRFLAVVEQRVQLVHERLHFARIRPLHALLLAFADARELLVKPRHARQGASHQKQSGDEA